MYYIHRTKPYVNPFTLTISKETRRVHEVCMGSYENFGDAFDAIERYEKENKIYDMLVTSDKRKDFLQHRFYSQPSMPWHLREPKPDFFLERK
jgi:hypothetical protein